MILFPSFTPVGSILGSLLGILWYLVSGAFRKDWSESATVQCGPPESCWFIIPSNFVLINLTFDLMNETNCQLSQLNPIEKPIKNTHEFPMKIPWKSHEKIPQKFSGGAPCFQRPLISVGQAVGHGAQGRPSQPEAAGCVRWDSELRGCEKR